MRRFNRNFGSVEAISRAQRQSWDHTYGGHQSKRFGLIDSYTQSLANYFVAPENNRPGAELLRHGWGNNFAGVFTEEGTNDFVGTGQQWSRRKRVKSHI
jgi:hypothetical protein